MGHIRLKRLPWSRKWHQVVALLAADAPIDEIAAASADASERALESARSDPALAHSFWLLTQLPLAARSPDFEEAARTLGVSVGSEPTLMDLVAAVSDATNQFTFGKGSRTDLGEMTNSSMLSIALPYVSILRSSLTASARTPDSVAMRLRAQSMTSAIVCGSHDLKVVGSNPTPATNFLTKYL